MRFLPLVIFSLACSVSSSNRSTQVAETTSTGEPMLLLDRGQEEAHLRKAHFYSHDPANESAREALELKSFAATLKTAPGTLRTRIDVVVRNPTKGQKQARIRVPIPANAAVTEAVLYVGDKPMRGAFLEAKRAEQVYKSYTQRRRDPLLAVWSGPSWVDLQIFPVEGEKTRRFQLEWVEPRIVGTERHRLPVLAHAGAVIGRPQSVTIDGQSIASEEGGIPLALPSSQLFMVRPPGGAFGYVLTSGTRPSKTATVLVAETSVHMSLRDRAKQRADIETLLSSLPASAKVSLLSADWLTRRIAVDQSPQQVLAALPELDEVISAGSLDFATAMADAGALAKEVDSQTIVYLGKGTSDFGNRGFKESTQLLRAASLSLFAMSPTSESPGLRSTVFASGGRTLLPEETLLAQTLRGHGKPPRMKGVARWALLDSPGVSPTWIGQFLGTRPAGASVGEVADLGALWIRSRALAPGRAASVRERPSVLTPTTSILVLESDAEYRRWSIPVPRAVEKEEAPALQIAEASQGEPSSRARALEQTRRAGALGVLAGAEGGFASVNGNFASGLDDRDIYGGLLGSEVGEFSGGWGFGLSGKGAGGGGTGWGTIGAGGTGWGTIGAGNYGTIGHGGSSSRVATPPKIRIGQATVTGSLNKDIIRRYIRRKSARIRHCYDKELLSKPDLVGTLVVRFQISAQGKVITVQANGMRNRSIEVCAAAAIKSIQFPKPRGGGVVSVRYPFTFTNGAHSQTFVSKWAKALTIFESAPAGEGAALVSKSLEADFESGAMLAWWIVKEQATLAPFDSDAIRLAAVLLQDSGDQWNSRRVLSQLTWTREETTSGMLKAAEFEEDRARMAALWR